MRKFTGSCHCGKVRFIAEIDLSKGSGRCNCSYCSKSRNWSITIKPEAFSLVSGHGDLSSYQFNTKSVQHQFCKTCGVSTFTKGDIPDMGGKFVSVRIACLDHLEAAELARIPVSYADGLNNNWHQPPSVTSYL